MSGLGRGLVAAALTPFVDGTTSTDDEQFAAQLRFIAASRPVAVAVAAVEVQEYHVLTLEQRAGLVRQAADALGDVPVIGGVSHADLRQSIELAGVMADAGARFVLAVASQKPWGAAPTSSELVTWYHQLADASPLPVLLYGNPRTGTEPSVEAIVEICRHPNVAAMKETSRSVIKLLRLCDEVDVAGHARVYTNMESIRATLDAGGSGAMLPPPALGLATDLVRAVQDGDAEEARRLQAFFGRFPSAWMGLGLGPAMKASMRLVGCDVGDPVHPFDALGPEQVETMREYLAGWGLVAEPGRDPAEPTDSSTDPEGDE